MLKQFVCVSFYLFLISGCALTETAEVAVEQEAHLDRPPLTQPQAPISDNSGSARAADENPLPVGSGKQVPAETVRRIQTHLKGSGFYSGPVDGINGSSTQQAIQRFQASCANLQDLVSNGKSAVGRDGSAKFVPSTGKGKRSDATAIRLVQLRLKDAGFDPGPIDGIEGARTRSALAALQSGCAVLQEVSTSAGAPSAAAPEGTPDNEMKTAAASDKSEERNAVKALQIRLRDAGLDPGPVDGILGPKTRVAMQKQQALR